MNTYPYDTAAIRSLLRAAFTAADLRRFCHDRPVFRFIVSKFGPAFSFEDMIETVIEQCEKQALFPDLLAAIREHNPRQYERYCDQLLAIGGRQRVVNLRPLDMRHTFKDRHREIQALRDYLADDRVRLVSVVGRGGMGKTALVSHVLAELEEGLLMIPGKQEGLTIDGILYLGARTTGLSLERIYADVGRMLGEPAASRLDARWTYGEASLAARVEYLLEALRNGLYLIVLDNLEDALAEDGGILDEGLRLFVERCLARPSVVRLITTSRERVRFVEAPRQAVHTISLLEGLPEEDAAELLRDLDPQGELELRDSAMDDLRQAARRTEGIPRALELLAGILDHDPTVSLLRLLADEHLFGEEVVERLVEEGYRRLGNAERRVMEALAVFDRPVEEQAVAYLLSTWFPDLDVRLGLRRLVHSHFVAASRTTGEYSLHPLDREYAYGQLPGGEEPDAYTQRNLELRAADWYVKQYKSEDEWHAIEDLAPQLAEFEHRVRARDYDHACQTLDTIEYDYLFKWGHYTRLVKMRLDLLEKIRDRGLCAHNLASLGHTFRFLGQVQSAIQLQKQALAAARELGDQWLEGFALGELGNAYRDLGDLECSIGYLTEALAMARASSSRTGEGAWLGNLGFAYQDLGQVEQAIACFKEALKAARETHNRRAEATWLGSLGFVYLDLGQVEQAILNHEEALSIAREIDDRRWEGIQLGGLASAYCAQGQVEKGICLHEDDLAVAREIRDRRSEGTALDKLGLAYYNQGQIGKAIAFHKKALEIFRELEDRHGESYCLLRLGKALLATGESGTAREFCAEGLALNVKRTSFQAAMALGIVLLHQADPSAGDTFADTITHCQAILGQTSNLVEARYVLATALLGRAVCDPLWIGQDRRTELLAPAMAGYECALETCAAAGVVRDALNDLELIRAAGVEGLEPVFELLQAHMGEVVSVT